MRSIILTAAVALFTLGLAPDILAQGSCPEIVQTALQTTGSICAGTGRNQACYGNFRLEAAAQPGVRDFKFDQIGDITDVSAIQALRLNGMNQETQEWGVAILKLQANLPNSLPGQNVTFVLFGDVEIAAAASPVDRIDLAPMQAFTLRTGIGDAQCEEAPQSGLMVQTPQGMGKVNFTMNGVDIQMGSTVFFQAQRGGRMTVRTVAGTAEISAQGRMMPVIAGTQVTIPMDDDLSPAGEPSLPEAYETEDLAALPLVLLEEEIEIADPLHEDEIAALWGLIEAGEPVCGDAPFSSCDDLTDLDDDSQNTDQVSEELNNLSQQAPENEETSPNDSDEMD